MTVYKRNNRPKKPWVFEWTIIDKDGKTKKRTQSFVSQKEAKKAQAKYMVEHDGDMPFDPEISFVDYFELWVNTYKSEVVSAVTLTKYETSKNNIEDYFKNIKVKDITKTKYQQFINHYIDDKHGHTHSKQSVEKLHSHAHQALLAAVDDGYLFKDPGANVALGGDDGKNEEEKFLEADDFEKLRDYCNEHVNPNRISLAMVQFAIYTGARISEIQAITWDDINEKKNTVRINKSFNWRTWKPERDDENNIIWPEDPKEIFSPTKNHEMRVLDVSPKYIATLHRMITTQKLKAANNPYHLLFIGQDGTPPTDNAVNKALRIATKKLDCYQPKFSFHGLRHSHGSYLLSEGVDIKYVSVRLGHKNLSVTLKVYTHILERLKKQEAEKAVKVL